MRFYTENGGFAFLSPLLGAMYDVHLRLIGKRVVDFLSSYNFFSLGVMAEALQAIIGSKSAIFDLSYGVKIWTDFSSVLSQFTRLTDIQNSNRVCIHSSMVKTRAFGVSNFYLLYLQDHLQGFA